MTRRKVEERGGYQPARRAGCRLPGVVGFGLPITLGSFFATEYVGHSFNDDPALSGKVLPGLYQPFAYWRWAQHYYTVDPNAFNVGLALFGTTFLAGSLGYVLYRGFRYRSARQHAGMHGTARYATTPEIEDAGLLPRDGASSEGVFCGLYQPTARTVPLYLKHDGPEHVLAVAPTRSGKGVSLIVPTLLTWRHSAFVLDMKGENYELTAGWRAKPINEGGAGNRVLRFEPGSPEGSCRWNPLDEIRHRTVYEVADADNMASILMEAANAGEGASDPYFQNAGRSLLSAIIIYTRYLMEAHGGATLADCYTVLTGSDPRPVAASGAEGADTSGKKAPGEANMDALRLLWGRMRDFQPDQTSDLIESIIRKVRLTGARLVSVADEELSGIVGSAATPLEPYLDPILCQNTAASDFSIKDLMDADDPVSLYYILPGTDIARLVPLTRMLIITMMRKLAPRMERDASGAVKAPHRHRLLMMMDEFPILGKIGEFQTSMAFLGGYGIKVYLIAQDLPQIMGAYGQYESIIGNCHIRIYFTPNRLETAEPLSRSLGKTTVITEQVTESGNRFGTVLGQVSRSYAETQRDLMTPDELLAMAQPIKTADGTRIIEPGVILVSVAGRRPILAKQSLWFLDPVLSERPRLEPPPAEQRAQPVPSAVPAPRAAFVVQ